MIMKLILLVKFVYTTTLMKIYKIIVFNIIFQSVYYFSYFELFINYI